MANINGTNKNDTLSGTELADVISAGRGKDTIDAGGGDDTVTLGAGDDKVFFREGDGNDTITDFEFGDRIVFDFNSYSDIMVFGPLYDGRTWTDFTGLTTFTVSATDVNSDGQVDTVISVNDQTLTLLGVAPEEVQGWQLMGG